MTLKGKTVIQLFDAKTGELTDTVENTNMVTNAVSNVLNGGLNAIVASQNNGLGLHSDMGYLYTLPKGFDIAKTFYGGLLVFSEHITEDANHCIPTITEIKSFIGCANQGTSISGNTFKGSLNTSESEQGEGYTKFVWDFTTEQCNGDIACLCLTSNCGGQLGWGFNALSSSYDTHNLTGLFRGMLDLDTPVSFTSSHSPMFQSAYNSGNPSGIFIDKEEGYIYYGRGTTFYKTYIGDVLISGGSSMLSSFNLGAGKTYEAIECSDTELQTWLQSTDISHCYYYYNSGLTTDTFRIKKLGKSMTPEYIDIPTTNILTSIFEYCGETTVRQRMGYLSDNWIIHNDKIYWLFAQANQTDLVVKPNKARMYVLNFDGTFTYKDIDFTDNMISMLFGVKRVSATPTYSLGISYLDFFGSLLLRSSDSTNGYVYYIVNEDGSLSEYPILATNYLPAVGIYKNDIWLKEPWCSINLSSRGESSNDGVGNTIEMVSGYLATINNQSTVLTKTSDKTMKIIYTLTEE